MKTAPITPALNDLRKAREILDTVAPSGYSLRHDPRVHEAQDLLAQAISKARALGIGELTLYRLAADAGV